MNVLMDLKHLAQHLTYGNSVENGVCLFCSGIHLSSLNKILYK